VALADEGTTPDDIRGLSSQEDLIEARKSLPMNPSYDRFTELSTRF